MSERNPDKAERPEDPTYSLDVRKQYFYKGDAFPMHLFSLFCERPYVVFANMRSQQLQQFDGVLAVTAALDALDEAESLEPAELAELGLNLVYVIEPPLHPEGAHHLTTYSRRRPARQQAEHLRRQIARQLTELAELSGS